MQGVTVLLRNKKIKLTDEQKNEFNKMVKVGIIKQLYKKNIISNEQLNLLIKMQDRVIS